MLFNYEQFKEELLESSKAQMMDEYIQSFGNNALEEEPFYKEHLSQFEFIPYRIPEELAEFFDWDLLAKLALGSVSSDSKYQFHSNEALPDLVIQVPDADGTVVARTIMQLWSFSILRLFEIFSDEQINLANFCEKDVKAKADIERDRIIKITKFKKKQAFFRAEIQLRQKYKNEKMALEDILRADDLL